MNYTVAAYDSANAEPVDTTGLLTSSISLTLQNNLVGSLNFTSNGPVNCTRSRANQAYDVVMLFDRSGSISSTDPNGQTLAAGRALAGLIAGPERARVAQFTAAISGGLQFLDSGFTSSQSGILTSINSVRAPGGDTPLWDAISDTIRLAGFSTSAARAVLIFSDGDDTSSQTSSSSALNQAVQNGIKLFTINLANPNSVELDRISVASGGLYWSTQQALAIVEYVRSLEQFLAGNTNLCIVPLRATFVPSNATTQQVAFGPARFLKYPLTFSYSLNGSPGQAVNEVTLLGAPGLIFGATDLRPVSTADVLDTGSNNFSTCLDIRTQCFTSTEAPIVRNSCSSDVVARVCDSRGVCATNAIPSREQRRFSGLQGFREGTACPRSSARTYDGNLFSFLPANQSGGSPNIAFSAWTGGQFVCVYEERFSSAVRPPALGTPVTNCPLP